MREDPLQKQIARSIFLCTALTHSSSVPSANMGPQSCGYHPTPRTKNGSWQPSLLFSLVWSPQVFKWLLLAGIFSEAHPLFKTDGSTSQETPPISYVQEKRATIQLSLLRPSSELLHPHWPPRRKRMNTQKTTKREKENKEGKLGRWTFSIHGWVKKKRRETKTVSLRLTCTPLLSEKSPYHHAARVFFSD